MKPNPLVAFHPEIAAWMTAEHGAPTAIQREVWPLIADASHVLASAPTGSGKTLCALLWALDRLLTGKWDSGTTRVLYVSPRRALNNDIRRNLMLPLAQLRQRFEQRGLPCADIQVATGSGDTPARERQRMVRQPPEILITTPESLNLLLVSKSGRGMLSGVRTLITDEVHAIAGHRRGVWLAAAAERWVDLAGEYQRVALPATVRPLDVIARWVGGHTANTDGHPSAHPRSVRLVSSQERLRLALRIEALAPDQLPEDGGRAGHAVGETSRAVLHPTHPHDLLEATAALLCAAEGDIEAIEPLEGCLDVLAQIIIASLLAAPQSAAELYAGICRAMPYRHLPQAAFDAVVDMLVGRHAGSRIRELRPRIHLDPDSGHLEASRGAAMAFYASGGMIPDRGYFQLRHAHSQTRIGELDEEFIWENGPGRAFSLGSQQWQVQRVTHNDVCVLPAPLASHAPPFWRSEERERGSHLSQRLARLLERWEAALVDGDRELGGGRELQPLDVQDPASPCGLGWPLAGLPLPAARSDNELVLGAGQVLLTYCRGKGQLAIAPEPGAELFAPTLATLSPALALRPVHQQRLALTQINGEPARISQGLIHMKAHFQISADHRALTFQPLTAEVR